MMNLMARTKRLTYLVHRWTGVVGCMLMALWFVSGIVMLFVGYPKLTPWERLAASPELSVTECCVTLDTLPDDRFVGDAAVVLTVIADTPAYVLGNAGKGVLAYSARDGQRLGPVTPERALAQAAVFLPNATLRYDDAIDEDRWTHARSLDAHRPLHRISVDGPLPGTLYVSGVTGQVVLDAPLSQQRWSYVGAWLHWLYMFKDGSVDPIWSWLVIGLSALCTVSALSGCVVGVWRWRFNGRYKTGARTPYREPWMRWHHIAGLLFGGVILAWIFSGLMSMNPLGIFSPKHIKPNLVAYYGGGSLPAGPLAQPSRVIQTLHQSGFLPVELHWRSLNAETYVLAYDRQAHTRLVRDDGQGGLAVSLSWPAAQALAAAAQLFSYPLIGNEVLRVDDAYYYRRHAEAMNGARQLGLPALRVDFADPGRTRVYIDLQTGAVVTSLDTSQRTGRWLFYFLHSWDTPGLLRTGPLRDLVIMVLSLGGLAVTLAGVRIGWRRVMRLYK
ncbi:PepSY domain-containing protein [Pusillimonas sp. T2]|uniref:PepSY domain-containing protein n=1 Tax=Pusillimonas sp. T2 TaxID=1548123 RepID=UPI0020B14965|nr:PepSY domain-containing protein [Pusillimonas sp. T2]